MICTACGKSTSPEARFCPACGAAMPLAAAMPRPELLRPRHGRMVAGVCAAFARTYGWNVTVVRILLVVLAPFHLGLGFIAYFAAWILIPEEPYLLPANYAPSAAAAASAAPPPPQP